MTNNAREQTADEVDRIRKAIENSIAEVSGEFHNQPGDFAYESDIRAVLFAKLRQTLADLRVNPDSKTNSYDQVFHPTNGINPVKSELPVVGSRKRFDIAILSKISSPNQERALHQPLVAAIEIKLWQDDQIPRGKNLRDGLLWDFEKLKTAISDGKVLFGVSLLFVHPKGAAQQYFEKHTHGISGTTEGILCGKARDLHFVAVAPWVNNGRPTAFDVHDFKSALVCS